MLSPKMLFLCAAVTTIASGCSPLRVSFDVGFAPPPGLAEREVMKDAGAGRNAPKIVMIPVSGFIADARAPGFLGAGSNPVDELVRRLEIAENDPNVKAIILRVNTPGGTVTGSDIMYRELRAYADRTSAPIIATMGEIATSGGYYVSLSADRIIAEPTTVTGSIGVIMQTMNFSGGLAKLGIEARAVKSGPNKDMANPFEPIEEEQYDILQGMIDDFYVRFRGLVEERRPEIDATDMNMATDGRVFTGDAALAIGLVDELGGIRSAFDAAKELSGLSVARLVAYTPPDIDPASPYGVTGETPRVSNESRDTQINVVQLNLPASISALTNQPAFLYVWQPALN